MKSEVLTTIFPCYQESKSNIVNSAKKIESLCKRFGLRSNFVVAQNGDEKEFDFGEEYISTCYIPHRGFGEVLNKSLRKVNGDYVYISSPDTPFDLMDLEQMLYVRYFVAAEILQKIWTGGLLLFVKWLSVRSARSITQFRSPVHLHWSRDVLPRWLRGKVRRLQRLWPLLLPDGVGAAVMLLL